MATSFRLESFVHEFFVQCKLVRDLLEFTRRNSAKQKSELESSHGCVRRLNKAVTELSSRNALLETQLRLVRSDVDALLAKQSLDRGKKRERQIASEGSEPAKVARTAESRSVQFEAEEPKCVNQSQPQLLEAGSNTLIRLRSSAVTPREFARSQQVSSACGFGKLGLPYLTALGYPRGVVIHDWLGWASREAEAHSGKAE